MQTSVSSVNPLGRAGLVADNRALKHIASRIAAGRIQAGKGVFRMPSLGVPGTPSNADPGSVYQLPNPAAAADVDAIIGATATSASELVIDSADVNGVVGVGVMYPARKLTFVLSSHANWDATDLVVVYVDHAGVTQTETLSVPDGGNTTLTTTGYASQFVSATFEAQAGTGGSFTIGVAAIDTITLADFQGVAMYDAGVVPADTSGSDAAEYEDKTVVPCVRKGAIWVITEDACSVDGDVYCRGASGSGGSVLGSFRSDSDTSTAFAVTGARYARTSGVGGLNIIELF